jgi:SAM-dependent methyltransferase
MTNIDNKTVESFGDEWSRYDQSGLTETEARKIFDEYFAVFPKLVLNSDAIGFDMGCGSGRWAKFVAPNVKELHCIDPSSALDIARINLESYPNVFFHQSSVETSGLEPGSQDFGYSLGVLHHVPDTAAAIRSCVQLLKPGSPLLLYLYYRFDNRPLWFRALWKLSDLFRRVIVSFPPKLKHLITDLIASLAYWPLARLSKLIEKTGLSVHAIPLSYYRKHSFYTMRTDARDRFGTPLEQRFNRQEIEVMLRDAGLIDIKFSDKAPYWCVVGTKV